MWSCRHGICLLCLAALEPSKAWIWLEAGGKGNVSLVHEGSGEVWVGLARKKGTCIDGGIFSP